jgi:hypothetical protein
MQNINKKQESARGVLLQSAADGAHATAYHIERWRLIVSIALMLAAILASVAPDLAPGIGIAGAAWSFVSFVLLGAASQRHTITSATIQQQFDTWLFELPWGSYAGKLVPDEELRRWSRRSTLDENRMKTWYPDVTGFPDPYAILACQRESLT